MQQEFAKGEVFPFRAACERSAPATADGGKTWTACGISPAGGWPVFADAGHDWQTDGRQIYRTQDGSRSWQTLAADSAMREALSHRYLAELDFIDSLRGWAVLESRSSDMAPALLATPTVVRRGATPDARG